MTRFRPCIDLHAGRVKQIVGGSLRDDGPGPETNFETDESPASFALRYRADDLRGAHVIMLGPGNEAAARSALGAWPGGLQVGGGINLLNAPDWLACGAAQVIVTSWLFRNGALDYERLTLLTREIGPEHLVIDLSCRRVDDGWRVATNRWQTVTDTSVNADLLKRLAPYCSEFLVHAADVEGKQAGIDEDLVRLLGAATPLPLTYAGGARSLADLERVAELSDGRLDLTIGSALDCFGGPLAYRECVAWNQAHA